MPHLEYVENILGHEIGHKFPQTNCIRGIHIFQFNCSLGPTNGAQKALEVDLRFVWQL